MTQYSGFPASGKFIDTKTNVEALGLVAGNEGALACATDTDLLGWWDGSAWHWLYDLNGSDHTLILDTDGDTHIAAPTDDQIDFTVASARQVHISDGILWPNTDNDIDLGSATYEFKDGYFDGIVYADTIDLGGNADTLILDADGDTTISAPTDDQIDFEVAGADQIRLTDGKFWPTANNDIDLGDATHKFKDGYFAGNMDIDGSLQVGNGTENIMLYGSPVGISGAAGTGRLLAMYTAGSLRLQMGLDGVAETGGNAGSNFHIYRYSDVGGYIDSVFYIQRQTGYFAVGNIGAPLAQMHVYQSNAAAGVPVLMLDQDDDSEGFIDFLGNSAASAVGPISTWTAGNSMQGFVRVEINGVAAWMPYYDAPTS